MKIRMLTIAAGIACLMGGPIHAQDEKKLFFLEFTHQAPEVLRLTVGEGDNDPQVYWYMLYTIKNVDEADHSIFISIGADSDGRRKYRDGYHPLAIERIRKMRGNEAVVRLTDGTTLEGRVERTPSRVDIDMGATFRSLKNDEVQEVRYKLWGHKEVTMPEKIGSVQASGKRPLGQPYEIARPVLKAGETRHCVAIFHQLDQETDRLTINVLGLTNDILVEATEPHTRKVTERIYQIVYERPGDEFYTSLDKITLLKKGWVDRERTIKTDLKSPDEEKK